jgi:hypothetical protein
MCHRAALAETTSLMIEELEVLIKRENSNITTQRTSIKPRKNSGTKPIHFRPQLQFWQRTKAKGRGRTASSARVSHQLQLRFCHGPSQWHWELSEKKTRVVSSTSKDIGDLPHALPNKTEFITELKQDADTGWR